MHELSWTAFQQKIIHREQIRRKISWFSTLNDCIYCKVLLQTYNGERKGKRERSLIKIRKIIN